MRRISREALYNELIKRDTSDLLLELEEIEKDDVSFDPDRFEVILEILDERAPVPFDISAKEGMEMLRNDNPELFDNSKRMPLKTSYQVKKHAFRSVAALLALVVLSGALLAVAYAANVPFAVSIVERGIEVITIRPSGVLVIEEEDYTGYRSLQEALDAYGITDKVAPTWVPVDFNLVEVTVSELDNIVILSAIYESGDKSILSRIVYYQHESYSAFEYSNTNSHNMPKGEQYIVGGVTHDIEANLGQLLVYWESSGQSCTCSITGDITANEIKKIIDSIY